MADYQKMASDVLQAVGGKENVLSVTHCMTRLRFNLKNESQVNVETVKKVPGVIGAVKSGGQFQVIIGQTVDKVYAEICKIGGFDTQQVKNENVESNQTKEKLTFKKVGSNILNYMTGSLTPLIPLLIAASMFKTVLAVCGPTMLGWITPESSLFTLLTFAGDAGFYFLPVIVGYTASKQMGVTPVLGMFMGAILIHPTFVQMAMDQTTTFTVFGIPCNVQNYSSSIIPILLSVWIMSYIEKFLNKRLPAAIKTIFAPTLTMFIMLPISLCLLAPAGGFVGQYISMALLSFGDVGGFVAVAVIAVLWEFLVISGMHLILIITMMTVITTAGHESLISPAATCATFAAMGMALGAFFRLKSKEEKSLCFGYFISGILGGVTEPALYGIGFKYKRPLIGMMIGAALGGLYAGITHVSVYVLGATNFLAVLSFAGGGTANLINGTISCVIALVGSAIATYFIGFKEEKEI